MYLFAPTYVPSMTASSQPGMSGLSQPPMAPAHTFGAATPIHTGVIRPLHAPLRQPHASTPLPIPHAAPIERRQLPPVQPVLSPSRVDRYEHGR